MARSRNFKLPFVYNCSGYETAEMIQLLDGYIDVYLPDFKFMSPDLSAKYSNAPDYPEHAKSSISEMVRQCGGDRKSTRLNSSHRCTSRMPSSA